MDSLVPDTVIGLGFVFAVFSLLVSAITEGVSPFLGACAFASACRCRDVGRLTYPTCLLFVPGHGC